MKRSWMVLLALLTACGGGLELSEWSGMAGQAKRPPKVSKVSVKGGEGVLATATVTGKYQGLAYRPSTAIDLSQVEAIEFDFFQESWGRRAGGASIVIYYPGMRTGVDCVFQFGKEEWTHVVMPVDLRTLRPLNRQTTATYGTVAEMRFSMYGTFGKEGQRLGVANLKFVPKRQGSGPLKVAAYRYVSKRDSGDASGTALTDGKASKDGQAFWRQYADEPVIDFDLGAL